jgi:N-methylhydantoinase A
MSTNSDSWRLGIDIGGTFTDGLLWNEATGERWAAKVLTTPDDLSVGFLKAFRQVVQLAGIAAADLGYLVHGTTVATNAVLEHQLAPTAYVTTRGFRDVFEIARQVRPNPYDVFTEKPPPPVSRDLCLEVTERMTAEGQVYEPLVEADVEAVADQIRKRGIASVGVCLLHSYVNPEHEQRVGALLQELLPDAVVTLSSDLAPEFREYPRACTTVVNAGLIPVVAKYLESIEQRLLGDGVLLRKLHVMQSNGGVLSFAAAARTPIHILESGPAAGVMGASQVGVMAGFKNLISFDMGGTTAKLGLIADGAPSMSQEFELGEDSRGREWFTGASGYPILTPSVDLVEIGAGGGSIAWVDTGGKLRVGPRSAGAQPGPACYGFGGDQPTVTDANLVLGRLDAHRALADGVKLDVEAARRAIGAVAAKLGMSVEQTALGIVEIANAAMVRAIRAVSVQRGHDAREFALIAFGGAGPLHAVALAEEMGIDTVIVQPQPGIASALGLLVTDIKHEYSTTWMRDTGQIDPVELDKLFASMEAQATTAIEEDAVDVLELTFNRALDMRYDGQSYQLVVPVQTTSGLPNLDEAVADFNRIHDRTYGYSEPSEPTTVVNVRLTAVGASRKPAQLSEWPHEANGEAATGSPARSVLFADGQARETQVFSRAGLRPGWQAVGPTIIDEADSTTVIPEGWRVTVSPEWNLLITKIAE